MFQIGVAPVRIDILTSVSGVSFDDAWQKRVAGTYSSARMHVIGRSELIQNKRSTGRTQDRADAERLERE
jgi:hypothetical protein